MIVDPTEVLLKHKSRHPFALPTSTSSVGPLPTVAPAPIDKQFVGHDGSITLWVVFAIMVIASAVFAAWSWTIPVSRRLYHVITTLITIFAALSYFAMATGHGVAVKHIIIRHHHKGDIPDVFTEVQRQIFWARYIDWSLTTPLLLLDLSLLAGLNGAHILIAMVADVIMVLTGMFATLGSDEGLQKWGWYTIACISYLVVIWHLGVHGVARARTKSSGVTKFFASIAGFTLLVWTAYPIVWGFGDGARRLSVDGEIIAYAVLDILAKPVFGLWLLVTHARMPEINVELGGFWANGLNREGVLRLGDDDGA